MLAEWAPIYEAMAADMGPGRRRGFSPSEVDEMELWQIARFLTPPTPPADPNMPGARRMTRAEQAAHARDLIFKRVAAENAKKAALAAGVDPESAAAMVQTPTIPAMVVTDEQLAALKARRAGTSV